MFICEYLAGFLTFVPKRTAIELNGDECVRSLCTQVHVGALSKEELLVSLDLRKVLRRRRVARLCFS